MKIIAFIILTFFYLAECRKTYAPIDKNANIAFINMETGGMRAGSNVKQGSANQALGPTNPAPTPKPAVIPQPITNQTPNPAVQTTIKAVPAPKPVQPTQAPNKIKPVPTPTSNPITTSAPGSVKQLINFYDSQGKASLIRPYTYSQAVKQG